MTVIVGSGVYVHAYPETTWGTKPGSPTYVFMPVETYDVQRVRNRRTSRPYFGNQGYKHGQTNTMYVQGGMAGALYGIHNSGISKSLAQFVCELGFGKDSEANATAINSIGIEHAQGPDIANVNHQGLRCNTFTLSGSADSGRWEYSADLIGKTEIALATAQKVPADLNKLIEFDFAGTVFKIAPIVEGVIGSYVGTEVDSIQIVRNHNLKTKTGTKTSLTRLDKTTRQTQLTFVLDKESDSYSNAARLMTAGGIDEYAVTMTLLGRTAGSHEDVFTRITIQINRAQLIDPTDTFNRDDYVSSSIALDCLMPDSDDPDIAIIYDTCDDVNDPLPGEET